MATPTIPNGEEQFFVTKYEGNGGGQRVGRFVPFTDNGTIANSLIFNSADSPVLSRTPSGTGTSKKTFTISAWIKNGRLINSAGDHSRTIYGVNHGGGSRYSIFGLYSGGSGNVNKFRLFLGKYTSGSSTTNFDWYTNRTLEDTSKWYHLMAAVDTTNSTADDRIKMYIDGERITSFASSSNPNLNDEFYFGSEYANYISTYDGSYGEFDGYIAELNFVDGTALTPDTFGVTDTSTGRWIPKALTGITYGTNGFRLQFGSSSALGDDTSGNNNDFSVSNLVAGDQTTDSPTQNHATIDPNTASNSSMTFAEGNLNVEMNNVYPGNVIGTLGASSGKYYWEVTLGGTGSSANGYATGVGVAEWSKLNSDPGSTTSPFSSYIDSRGNYFHNGTYHSSSTTFTSGDVISIALNLDDSEISYYKNNSIIGSAQPLVDDQTYFPLFKNSTTVADLRYTPNFGQKSWNYTPPTGFVALQQDNLPETSKGVTGLAWMKNRDATDASQWYDSSRGKHVYFVTNSTAAEATATDGLQKFLKGGQQIEDNDGINTSGESFVSWNWVGNGATEVTNNDGSNTTTVQANTTAGFSIVKFTPPASGFDGITYGHGLTQTPEWILWKRRDSSMRFLVYHHKSYANSNGGYALEFSASNANSAFNTEFGSTSVFTAAPNATTFALRNNSVTAGGQEHMAYCWHGVDGFSKFGEYDANNSTDGPFVYLGFKPKFLIIKSSAAISWYIIDATRGPINPVTAGFTVDNSQAEFTNQFTIDFLSNGFKIRNSNASYGASTNSTSHDPYYYMAFAEHPFVGDGTNPVTAR